MKNFSLLGCSTGRSAGARRSFNILSAYTGEYRSTSQPGRDRRTSDAAVLESLSRIRTDAPGDARSPALAICALHRNTVPPAAVTSACAPSLRHRVEERAPSSAGERRFKRLNTSKPSPGATALKFFDGTPGWTADWEFTSSATRDSAGTACFQILQSLGGEVPPKYSTVP